MRGWITWSKLIDAKEQLEKRLEEPITYTRVGSSGGEFTLRATTALTASFLDQDRIARPLVMSGRRECVLLSSTSTTTEPISPCGPQAAALTSRSWCLGA